VPAAISRGGGAVGDGVVDGVATWAIARARTSGRIMP
jgi:hypothetical protein